MDHDLLRKRRYVINVGTLVVALAFGSTASVSAASLEAKQLREQAKASLERYQALGEPKDRCSLSASLAVGPVIVRTMPGAVFRPGDELVALNGSDLHGKSVDHVVAQLRQIPADATIPATVEREGQTIELSVACINARQIVAPSIAAMELAARGKFDECVNAVSHMPYVDTFMMTFKAQCASASKNALNLNASSLVAQAMDMWIDDAAYAVGLRSEVAQKLRNAEGVIIRGQGIARYQALVDKTRRWPGGETVFASSTPDWALFRRNAETALRGHLIDPDSAKIQWPYGFLLGAWKVFLSKPVEGYWTCGTINARNRMGGYAGSTSFVIVMDPRGYVRYSEIGESKDVDLLSASCAKSVKLLPPPPPELSVAAASSAGPGLSLADELKKLTDLHAAGALTDAEFQAAKQRLLQDNAR